MPSNKFLNAVLAFAVILNTGIAYIVENDQSLNSFVFPTEYHFKGETIELDTHVMEPFEIWYSTENNRSRIDVFGSMVKTYYVAGSESYSISYSVYPMSTEKELNVLTCSPNIQLKAYNNFLPTSDNFNFVGYETYNGKYVRVFKKVKKYDDDTKKTVHTLHVYRQNDIDIPVRLESRVIITWNGALSTHTISNYYDFSEPSQEDFDYESEDACKYEDFNNNNDLRNYIDFLSPHHHEDQVFLRYKTHYNKDYDEKEHEIRKTIFKQNWLEIKNHNQKNLGYKMTINKFSDRTAEELAYLAGTRASDVKVNAEPFPFTEEELEDMELPENYDMRIDGVISYVKDQANCGSCWAFSTTAAVEGILARNNGGKNINLSEQSLIDCAWGYHNHGCSGGVLQRAFEYIVKHGIPSEMDYGSYMHENGYCHLKNVSQVYRIKSFAEVTPLSVNAMKAALYHYGPVAVNINAMETLYKYSNGIYFEPDCNDGSVNHGVTVVGYGVRDGAQYWIVKNSWGEDWGEDGYVLMSAKDDNCLLLTMAYYPIV